MKRNGMKVDSSALLDARRFKALLMADEITHPVVPPLGTGGWHASCHGPHWSCGVFAHDLVLLADRLIALFAEHDTSNKDLRMTEPSSGEG